MAYETILYDKDTQDKFATITLNRPDKLNAMNKTVIHEIDHALAAAVADPADYCRYLSAMALVYGGLEPGLFAALTAGLSRQWVAALGVRPKFPALCADIEANGLRVPASVPVVVVTPADGTPVSLSTAVGGLYVLEGATLGGRLIVRQLRRQLGGQLIGASFLDFHGDQAAAAWKGFSRALEGLAMAQLVVSEQSIAGARAGLRSGISHPRRGRHEPL